MLPRSALPVITTRQAFRLQGKVGMHSTHELTWTSDVDGWIYHIPPSFCVTQATPEFPRDFIPLVEVRVGARRLLQIDPPRLATQIGLTGDAHATADYVLGHVLGAPVRKGERVVVVLPHTPQLQRTRDLVMEFTVDVYEDLGLGAYQDEQQDASWVHQLREIAEGATTDLADLLGRVSGLVEGVWSLDEAGFAALVKEDQRLVSLLARRLGTTERTVKRALGPVDFTFHFAGDGVLHLAYLCRRIRVMRGLCRRLEVIRAAPTAAEHALYLALQSAMATLAPLADRLTEGEAREALKRCRHWRDVLEAVSLEREHDPMAWEAVRSTAEKTQRALLATSSHKDS